MAEEPGTEFERATPVLRCSSYPATRAFFVDTLGFAIAEEGGDPAQFGIFKRGGATVFVDGFHGPLPQADRPFWSAYIHVKGVDALYADLSALGVTVYSPLATRPYGMREFEVQDPDGNVICFGEDADFLGSA